MADINEEQLLNDLLRDLGAADAQIGGTELEARVLAAWDADAAAKKGYAGRTPFPVYFGIAAMVTLAVMVTLWTVSPAAPVAPVALVAPVAPVESASAAAPLPPSREALRRTSRRDKPSVSVAPSKPIVPAPVAPFAPIAPVAPDLAQSPIEFVPLVPMTEQELTGSFQIVRVQMPRASLGALTSPIHHPSELVEADVLLGEDGMARAIHISTNGSVYPWRPR